MHQEHRTALLVEADSMVLADLEDALCGAGFSCLAFQTAAEAGSIALGIGTIGLAVLDWSPASRHLAEQLLATAVPVILTTAGAGEAPEGSVVLRKPYLSSQLQALIAGVMARRGALNA